MAREKLRGFNRLVRACGATRKGLLAAWREEAAFRQELVVVILAVPLALWLGRSGVERALLLAPMLLILVIELVNSAIEAAIDRIGFERHELSGLAKDLGSAAVFMSFVILVGVWILVLAWR
jgi:diacylglycerol kinase (ATP)